MGRGGGWGAGRRMAPKWKGQHGGWSNECHPLPQLHAKRLASWTPPARSFASPEDRPQGQDPDRAVSRVSSVSVKEGG